MVSRAALVFLVLVLLTASLPNSAHSAQRDTEEAADAAVALSRLEAAGNFHALYDRLHPDAKHVVPRAAVVGWYEADFAPLGPGVITVQSVQFEDWTWGVTGKRYRDTAVVAYTQPFADGSITEDVVRLVEHGGGWGWFFGRDRAFVDKQIERFGAQPTPTARTAQTGGVAGTDPDDDQVCRETAEYWTTDLGMGTNAIAVLSGCRQDRSGTWFLPTGPSDPRLPEPILTPEEERQTAALRTQIETDLDLSELDTMMPSWMPDAVNRLATLDDKRPITGWRDPSVMVGNLPSQYAPIMDAFLQDPNRLALRNYARWWFDRRAAAAPLAACDNLNPIACQAVETQLGIGARPWPWDLTDPFTLAEYLDWALVNGVVVGQPTPPPSIPTPISTSLSTSTAACPELGAWLGETTERYRSAIAAIEAVGLYPFPDSEAVEQFGHNAAELERIATDQEASDAPDAGLALNAVLIRALETYRDSFEVLTEAYRTGDQATSGEGWTLRQEAQ
ncbi:MAG: hypothetical protein M3Q71_20305, partial [Chloroflexota bacterium]|nr:hypothetical protein [Chloroflexota bacterium]